MKTEPPWPPRYRRHHLALYAVALLVIGALGQRTGLWPALGATIVAPVQLSVGERAPVAEGLSRFFGPAWPPAISLSRETDRIVGFDPGSLPPFATLRDEVRIVHRFDHASNELVPEEVREQVLVEPVGYLALVLGKMLESAEIAVLGTLLALLLGLPLAVLGAKSNGYPGLVRHLARGLSSASRAVPELVFALIFVLAYDFGPVAGIMALGAHCFGFFGKFLADDFENADRGPAEALAGAGASRLSVLRWALWPAVYPQFIVYAQYIFERNVRSATVLGIVGAGGIGMELKGRFDAFQFDHVMTILLVIIASVWLLERLAQSLRAKIL